MKKVFVIAVILMMVSSAVAFADATNWLLTITPVSGTAGSQGDLIIGTWTGYTSAATDAGDVGLEGDPGMPPAGPYAAVLSNGGLVDCVAPIVAGQSQTWTINYSVGNGANSPVVARFAIGYAGAPSVDLGAGAIDVAPVYSIAGQAYAFTIAGQKYTAANPMPNTFDVALGSTSGSFQVSFAPVPEPGSLLALGSGLIGLAGFAIRRRR